MSIQVDAALGGPWETIGKVIKRSGQEDASGFRRCLVSALARNDFETFHRMLPIERSEFDSIRAECVKEWGEPDDQ